VNEQDKNPSDRLNQSPLPTTEQALALISLRELLGRRSAGQQVATDELARLRAVVWTIPPAEEA